MLNFKSCTAAVVEGANNAFKLSFLNSFPRSCIIPKCCVVPTYHYVKKALVKSSMDQMEDLW